MKTTKHLICGASALLLTSVSTPGVEAAQLQIQFTGLDLQYCTFQLPENPGGVSGDIFDAGGVAGGAGIPSEADPLSFVDFLVDGDSVGSLTSDIYLDTFIQDVWNIPVGGGTVQSQGNPFGFGFDLLTQPGCGSGCWGLALDIDTAQINYNGTEISIQGSGTAASVFEQMLPSDLHLPEVDESKPITFDFTGTAITHLTDNGTYLTGFDLAGTGTITATLVPVPAAVWLFGSGLLGLVAVARRRNKA